MGWLLGPYERGAPACFVDGVPATFEKDLFPGDLDRLLPHVEAAARRVPSFENAGIKQIINGPIPYTPDGNPMVGPAFGLPNFWLSEGHSFGITAAGGSGWQLAEWMIEGEPGVDMIGVDPRRFGVVSRNFAKLKNAEAYEHVFVTHYPMEERPACRPAKAPPSYGRMDRMGAVWGQRFGWERPRLVRAGGGRAQGRLLLPPVQLVRARRRRGAGDPRAGGAHRAVVVLQVRSRGPRGAGVAGPHRRQRYPQECRPHVPCPCPQPLGFGPVRVHRYPPYRRSMGRAFLPREFRRRARLRPRLSHQAAPRGPLGLSQGRDDTVRRVRSRRPGGARYPAAAGGRRRLERSVSLADRPRDPRGLLSRRAGLAGQLRGISAGMGAPSPDRVPQPPVRRPDGGGRGAWSPPRGDAGDGLHAPREVVPAVGNRSQSGETPSSRPASNGSFA